MRAGPYLSAHSSSEVAQNIVAKFSLHAARHATQFICRKYLHQPAPLSAPTTAEYIYGRTSPRQGFQSWSSSAKAYLMMLCLNQFLWCIINHFSFPLNSNCACVTTGYKSHKNSLALPSSVFLPSIKNCPCCWESCAQYFWAAKSAYMQLTPYILSSLQTPLSNYDIV